ncbi:unnamed protein product [Hymenolepis diminuta]|nr:unnamed protein product [Hymenolepis diminuta]
MPAACATVIKPTDIFETTVEGIISQPGAKFTVYKAHDKRSGIDLAIKAIPLKDPNKRIQEIKILESLRDCPNVAKLLGSISTSFLPSHTFLTLEYVNSVSWYQLQNSLTPADLRHYMYQLITALVACHDRIIIHRSVKPDNLLIDPSTKHLRLIGWSNAACMNSNDYSELDPCSYEYLSPELILNGPSTGFSTDLWPVGCIIASIILAEPLLFYQAKDQLGQLAAIIKIVGNEKILKYIDAYKVAIAPNLREHILSCDSGNYKRLTEANDEAADLMVNLMTVDPFQRITAKQALSHPFLNQHHHDQSLAARFASRLSLGSNSNSSASSEAAGKCLPYFDYKFSGFVGEGTFGQVYRIQSNSESKALAVKIMRQKNYADLYNEFTMLEKLQDIPNVVKFYGTIIADDFAALIFEFVEFTPWKRLYNSLKSTEIQYYIYQLLLALQACHDLQIMHRDIKPSNLVINPALRQLRLVDWGQATYYHQGKEYDVHVGTHQYKSPELHLGYKRYNLTVDMWPVGCILASAIFRQRYMFSGGTIREILLQITHVVGSEPMFAAMKKAENLEFRGDEAFMNIKPKDFSTYINDSNKKVAIKSAIDLVSRLLVCDPEKRYSATQALKHSYLRRAHQFPAEIVT